MALRCSGANDAVCAHSLLASSSARRSSPSPRVKSMVSVRGAAANASPASFVTASSCNTTTPPVIVALSNTGIHVVVVVAAWLFDVRGAARRRRRRTGDRDRDRDRRDLHLRVGRPRRLRLRRRAKGSLGANGARENIRNGRAVESRAPNATGTPRRKVVVVGCGAGERRFVQRKLTLERTCLQLDVTPTDFSPHDIVGDSSHNSHHEAPSSAWPRRPQWRGCWTSARSTWRRWRVPSRRVSNHVSAGGAGSSSACNIRCVRWHAAACVLPLQPRLMRRLAPWMRTDDEQYGSSFSSSRQCGRARRLSNTAHGVVPQGHL